MAVPLRSRLGADWTARRRGAVVTRLLSTPEGRVVVHAWQPRSECVCLRAASADVDAPASTTALELAIERMRFALGVDDDFSEFARTFRGDPLIGEAIHNRPWFRPRRRPWPWEALAWAVTEQLIEARRAAEIQRRMVRRWGGRLQPSDDPSAAWMGPGPLRDVPSAAVVAGIAPAELESCDLAAKRAIAMIHCAREIAAERVDPGRSRHRRPPPADLEHRPVDAADPRLPRSRRPRRAARRRPGLHQAGRRSRRPRPQGDGRGGRGVLRAVRAVPRPRRGLRVDPLARRRGGGPAAEARGVGGSRRSVRDLPRQPLVREHLGCGWAGRDQAPVGEEAGELLPFAAVHVSERPRAVVGQQQWQGALDLGVGQLRVEAVAGVEDRCGGRLGVADGRLRAALERCDEQAGRLGVVGDVVGVGNQDELVVRRDPELVDRRRSAGLDRAR